ncbi:MAG TPA: hypothetical protein VL527_14465, partial [Dongiaceae bacterium]|nr:hypothetical protein [Dongiaceae bacterium]
ERFRAGGPCDERQGVHTTGHCSRVAETLWFNGEPYFLRPKTGVLKFKPAAGEGIAKVENRKTAKSLLNKNAG